MPLSTLSYTDKKRTNKRDMPVQSFEPQCGVAKQFFSFVARDNLPKNHYRKQTTNRMRTTFEPQGGARSAHILAKQTLTKHGARHTSRESRARVAECTRTYTSNTRAG